MQPAQPGPTGSSSIKRLEARGNVVVTQKDQIVTGDTGMFDTKANLMTMTGGVVLTQCKNVLQRRSPGGRHDHRHLAGRIRHRQGRRACSCRGEGCGGTTPGAPGAPPAPAPGIGSLLPGKPK